MVTSGGTRAGMATNSRLGFPDQLLGESLITKIKTLGELEAVNEENIRQDPMENIRRLLQPGPRGGAICTFQIPGNAYNILSGDRPPSVNWYLPQISGDYTVILDKSRRELSGDKERRRLQYDSNNCQGIKVPRPGGYAVTLPANQKIVIKPCDSPNPCDE